MAPLKGTLTPAHTVRGEMSIGGDGTNNYPDLENKPQINGVELVGNKSLDDLGIDIPTKTSELDNDSGYVNSSIVANPYDATSTYDVGAYVTHENNLYKCNTAITTAEEWNAEHWTLVDVISAIPTKTSELDNDSGFASIDDNSTDNNKAWSSSKITDEIINILPTGTASGSVASFNTSLALPLVSLKANVSATPSGVSQISLTNCGANLCNQADIVSAYPTKYTVDSDGSIKTVGNLGLSDVLWTNKSKVSGVLNVVFVSKYQNAGSVGIRPKIIYTDATSSVIYTTNTQDYSVRTLLTTSGKTVEKIVVDYGTNNPTNFYIEVTLDTSATTYEAYNGNTEAINLGETIYNGGTFTQDNAGHRTLTADGTTINLPDGTPITTLIGTNNIYNDSGNTEVVYKESINEAINDAIAELQALFLS